MTARVIRRAGAALATSAVALALILVPSAASAAVVTTVAFETASPVAIGFSENWSITLRVEATFTDGPTTRLRSTDGTVDVYFSGIGGAFAAGLPIQPDGLVYVSQPTDQPLLPAGEYQVSALFNPSPGGYYQSGQTATPLTFTVTDLEVIADVEVVTDAAVSELSVITASLSGPYVDEHGGAPAGTWHFIVSDVDGIAVFDTEVAQTHGSTDPVRVEIATPLRKGGQYLLQSTFIPVDELAGGITVSAVSDVEFQTPSGSFGEALAAAAPIPLWLAILVLVLLLGLATAAVFLGLKLSARRTAALADGPATPSEDI